MFVKPAIPDRPPGDSPVFCRCSGLRLLPIYTLFCFLFTAVGCQTEPSTSDAPSAGMETPVEIVEIRGADTSKMVSKVPTIEKTGVGGLEQPIPSSSRPTDEEVQRPSRSPPRFIFNRPRRAGGARVYRCRAPQEFHANPTRGSTRFEST